MIYFLISILIVLIAVFCYYENNKLDITEYSITNENIINELKIAHLSDMHSKPAKNVFKALNEIKPDVIMITGDFINDKARRKQKMLDYAKELCTLCPVYYITGNHERRLDDFEDVMADLKDAGFNVLLNEVESANINGSRLAILGLDENQADFKDYKARRNGTFVYKDMRPYFETLSEADGYKIVLSHFPENFEKVAENNYSQYDFDLQLSGHAHGGQFIMPFIGPLYSPGQGVFPKYARGSFGERPKLIVSRGIGNAEFPLRLFNHPEINVITLKKPQ